MSSTPDPRVRSTPKPLILLERVVPGVRRVREQVEPYAAAWERDNVAALERPGPLWVALGDSMTQGIGARSIRAGWVGQLQRRLAEAGQEYRVVNLSRTGARVREVVETQLPALHALEQAPDLVTVLIGANDMIARSRRVAAVGQFDLLLAALPRGVAVVCELPRRNREARVINSHIQHAGATGRIRVAAIGETSLRGVFGTLADDYFHPNGRGYAAIADTFERALRGPGPGGA